MSTFDKIIADTRSACLDKKQHPFAAVLKLMEALTSEELYLKYGTTSAVVAAVSETRKDTFLVQACYASGCV
jgi:hypothetical protein